MSEIIGIDLTPYEEATVAQFCDLDLKQHVTKLKPITFIAESEGDMSDEVNFIANYWNEVNFTNLNKF